MGRNQLEMNRQKDLCKELEKSLIACIQPGKEKIRYYCVDSSDIDKIGPFIKAISTYYVYLINNGDRDLEVNAASWHQEPNFVKLSAKGKHLVEEYSDWMFDFINEYGVLIRVENAGQFRVNFTIYKYIPHDEDMTIVPVLDKNAQILPIEVEPEEKEGEGVKKYCLRCRSKNVIPIVYGLVGDEVLEEAEKGLILLGGCIVSEYNPRWHCKDCRHEF
jgi:hypothetical protein